VPRTLSAPSSPVPTARSEQGDLQQSPPLRNIRLRDTREQESTGERRDHLVFDYQAGTTHEGVVAATVFSPCFSTNLSLISHLRAHSHGVSDNRAVVCLVCFDRPSVGVDVMVTIEGIALVDSRHDIVDMSPGAVDKNLLLTISPTCIPELIKLKRGSWRGCYYRSIRQGQLLGSRGGVRRLLSD